MEKSMQEPIAPNELPAVSASYDVPIQGDLALKAIQATDQSDIDLSEANIARVLRKIDIVLLPIMAITEMLQFLDKSTLSYASIFGIIQDTHLVGTDYSWLSSIFYFGYMVSQPLSGAVLQRYPASKCLAVCVFFWSVILFMHVLCDNWAKLMVVRFFLGVVEGLTFPAFILINAAWWPRKIQPFRMGFWFSFNGIAQILGGLLAYGLGHIQSGIASWKWMFLVTAAITTLWSILLYFYLPDSQLNAWFLKPDEKIVAIEMIRNNNTGTHSRTFKMNQFMEALTDVKTWAWFLICFFINIPNSVASFGNLVIAGFGFSSLETTLLSMPAGGLEFIYIMGVSYLCARYPNTRTPFVLLSLGIGLIGGILVLALPYSNKAGLLVGYYIIYCFALAYLLLLSLLSANVAGHTKKITINAINMIAYSAGNIAGPQFYKSDTAPRYYLGIGSLVVSFGLCMICFTYIWFYLARQNKKREARRLEATGTAPADIEFLDLTDKENPLFVYVY